MWPETPCKICGVPTTDEGGFCSIGCLRMEEPHHGDPGDEHDYVHRGDADPLTVVIQTEKDIALFDRVVSEYLSMMEAYHSFEDDPRCHACQLRREVKAYADRRVSCQT